MAFKDGAYGIFGGVMSDLIDLGGRLSLGRHCLFGKNKINDCNDSKIRL